MLSKQVGKVYAAVHSVVRYVGRSGPTALLQQPWHTESVAWKPACSLLQALGSQVKVQTGRLLKEEVAHWALHGIIAGAALEEAGHALGAVGKG